MDTVKLALTGKAVNFLQQKTNFVQRHYDGLNAGRVSRDEPYRKLYFHEGQHGVFRIQFAPKFKNISPVMLTFHASHFESFSVLEHDLLELFSDSDSLDGSKVSRLDLCVDLKIDYEAVFASITQPRVIKVKEISSNSRTLYLGARPKVTTVYEKVLSDEDEPETNYVAFNKRLHCQTIHQFQTRVEVRFFKGHKSITHWGDLWKIHKIDPFSHLEVKSADYDLLREMPRKKRLSLQSYLFETSFFGAQMAKKNFGKNWSKRVKPYLTAPSLDLHKSFKEQMAGYGLPHRPREFRGRAVYE